MAGLDCIQVLCCRPLTVVLVRIPDESMYKCIHISKICQIDGLYHHPWVIIAIGLYLQCLHSSKNSPRSIPIITIWLHVYMRSVTFCYVLIRSDTVITIANQSCSSWKNFGQSKNFPRSTRLPRLASRSDTV